MGETAIEWADWSVNPLRAMGTVPGSGGHYCEKISPGCANCYSSRMQRRFRMPQFQEQRGANTPTRYMATQPLADVLRRRKPTRIFWCDMTDMFGDWVTNQWIAICFGVMAATPWHTHIVLTKRAKRLPEWFAWATKRGEDGLRLFADDPLDWRIRQMCHVEARRAGLNLSADRHQNHGGLWPLPNVHIGVSCEDQDRADERLPYLLQTPAAVRLLSLEPLIGPIKIPRLWDEHGRRDIGARPGISWVIAGGESGPGARPCDVAWIRSIVRQCKAADVPCFVKQLGAHVVDHFGPARGRVTDMLPIPRPDGRLLLKHKKGGNPAEWPEDLRVREFPRWQFQKEPNT